MARIMSIVLSAFFAFSASANAALIGSFGNNVGFGALGASDGAVFTLGYSLRRGGLRPPIFISTPLAGDMSAVVDSGSAFEAAAEKMTDGVIERLGTRVQFTLNGEPSGGEGAGFPEIDLSGSLIEAFVLTVTDFSRMSPGSDPNGDGDWTDLSFKWRVDVHGTPAGDVPLPAAAAHFLSALGAFAFARSARLLARSKRKNGFPADGVGDEVRD